MRTPRVLSAIAIGIASAVGCALVFGLLLLIGSHVVH